MQIPRFFTTNIWHHILEWAIPSNHILTIKELQEYYTPFIKNPESDSLEFIWVCSEYSVEIKKIINQAKKYGYYNYLNPLIDNLIYQLAHDTACYNSDTGEDTILQDIWPDIITCVPPDPLRYRVRGYHLPIIIAKKLSKTLMSSFQTLVTKAKTTQSQSELNREERIVNLEGKFQPISDSSENLKSNPNPTIWLVDDISTTGSTLNAVAQSIKKQLPESKIYGIVLSGGLDD